MRILQNSLKRRKKKIMKKRSKLTYTQIIVLGFACIILFGAVVLCTPFASQSGEWTPFEDSIFTAVSATCVTGLTVCNTAEHWSVFGQVVILCLIQVGGLGFVSIISIISMVSKKNISLHNKRLLMESAGYTKLSGVDTMLKRLISGSLIFELCGAAVLTVRFMHDMPFSRAVYYGVFHSVSAFCNAGFDILGDSLVPYVGDLTVNLTVIMLIVIGGLGFFVWNDIALKRFKFKKFSLQTKIVLCATALLIVCGWLAFFITEKNAAMAHLNVNQRLIASLFQSVTPRTAGFYSVDQSRLSESGSLITVVLMLIGGSPGSTAGGIKTTTFFIVIASIIANARNSANVQLFRRRVDADNINHASAVCGLYILCVVASVMLMCAIEPFSLREILYEAASAMGTAGLSMGITASLTLFSRILLMLLMFAGRIGGLTLALAFAQRYEKDKLERPIERILIG